MESKRLYLTETGYDWETDGEVKKAGLKSGQAEGKDGIAPEILIWWGSSARMSMFGIWLCMETRITWWMEEAIIFPFHKG